MKKFLISLVALGATMAVSCNKDVPAPKVTADGSPVEVTVSIKGSPASKATGVTYAEESQVNSLQVFVFNGNELEAHRSVTGATMTLIPATSGERTVWAVVNAPDLYSVLNVSDEDPMTLLKLKSAMSNLSDNSIGGFVMSGSVTQELVDGGNVVITVKRNVARVSIEKISASLKDYREAYSVRVKGIYLINVPANCSYDMTISATAWANPLKHADASFDALLFDDLSTADPAIIVKNDKFQKEGVDIREDQAWVYEKMITGEYVLADGVTRVQDNSYTKEHVFYTYPNKYGAGEGQSTSYDITWSERGTILVIEAEMLDENGNPVEIQNTDHQTVGYYPLPLPAMERNKTYTINEVKITRLPGDVPFKPIETGESKVTISVADWEVGINLGTVSI